MTSEIVFTILGCLIGSLMVLAVPLIGLQYALPALVLLRSLTDIGASSTGSLLPSSLISGALAVVAIFLAALPSRARAGTRTQLLIVLLVAGICFSTLIGALHFGIDVSLVSESVRLVSLLAVFAAAVRLGRLYPEKVPNIIATVVALPSAILIGGYLVGAQATVNGAGRAVGSFSHANTAAAYMSIAALLLLGIWWFTRSRLALVAGIFALIGLFLTQSLGGILGFATAALAIIVISSGLSTLRKAGFLIVAGALSVFLFTISGAANRLDEFDTDSLGVALRTGVSADSLGWRLVNWSILADVWARDPVFGYGIGTTSTYIMPLGAPPHSLPVQLLVEVGLAGVLVLFFVAVFTLRMLNKQRRAGRWEPSVVLGAIVFVIVNGSESNLLGYTAATYLLALGTGLLWGRVPSADPPPLSIPPKLGLRRDPTHSRGNRTKGLRLS